MKTAKSRRPNCAVEYMYLIWAIGCDYDGYNDDAESLKQLIDEFVNYANEAITCCYEGKILPEKAEDTI